MMKLTKEQLKIIDAAFKKFAEVGIENTNMSHIAKDLGYTRTFVYYYFPDKLSIYLSALDYKHGLYKAAIDKMLKSDMLASQILEKIFKLRVKLGRDLMLISACKNQQFLANLYRRNELTEVMRVEEQIVSNVIKRGIADGSIRNVNPAKTAALILQGLNGFVDQAVRTHLVKGQNVLNHADEIFKNQLKLASITLQGIST